MGPGEIVTDKGTMTFTVQEDLPDQFYYQCQRHPYMGNKVVLISSNASKQMLCDLMLNC